MWPVNIQDFSKPYSDAVINGYAPSWLDWLGPETIDEFKRFGYYSTKLKYKDGSLVSGNTYVIGINTQACNTLNLMLLKNRYDPGNQLAWLESELKSIEAVGG